MERKKQVLASLPEPSLQIVEFAREHGRVTIGEAINLTNANRNTLKQHFLTLVERGYLNRHGAAVVSGTNFADPEHISRAFPYAAYRTDLMCGKEKNISAIILHIRRCTMKDTLMFWGTYILVLAAGLGLLGISWPDSEA